MKLSDKSLHQIEKLISEVAAFYGEGQKQEVITDLHVYWDAEAGTLNVYDDEDRLQGSAPISDWQNAETEIRMQDCEREITRILHKMQEAKRFEKMCIVKPYSFVWVNKEHETLGELLLVDDDTLLLNEELLSGLDQELNEFLEKLMEE